MNGRLATEHISFRAPPALIAALVERASKAGCSTSEYLRGVLRERVGQ